MKRLLFWWWATLWLGCGVLVTLGLQRWELGGVLIILDVIAYWHMSRAARILL